MDKKDGTKQIQAGGVCVFFTRANENAIDDVAALFEQAEDIETVIARLTVEKDGLQEMAYARLRLQRAANAEMHAKVAALPGDISRHFRVTGLKTPLDPTSAELAAVAATRKEMRRLAVNESAA